MKQLITTTAAVAIAAGIVTGAAQAGTRINDCDLIVAPGSNYLTCATGSIRSTEWVPEDRAEQDRADEGEGEDESAGEGGEGNDEGESEGESEGEGAGDC